MINAGGGAFTDSNGNTWQADTGFIGGTTTGSPYDVGGTVNDPLYYTRRVGQSFSYSIAVPNGAYQLRLRFAEPFYTTAGKRKFDVLAEGATVLNDFDIVASGGAKTAVVKTVNVTVNDGRLSLFFDGVVDNATVSAIELI